MSIYFVFIKYRKVLLKRPHDIKHFAAGKSQRYLVQYSLLSLYTDFFTDPSLKETITSQLKEQDQ